jgi:hypothetical protein
MAATAIILSGRHCCKKSIPSYDRTFIQENSGMIKIKRFKDEHNAFKWKHFEGDIILWLVRWYAGMLCRIMIYEK